jgi:iron complex transport system substrate-binding protein
MNIINGFPVKLELRHARQFRIRYEKSCIRLEVLLPWIKDGQALRYLLYQRGTAPPPSSPGWTLIPIPVRRVVTMSTTYLAFLKELELLGSVVAVDHFHYVNSPQLLQRIRAKTLEEIGSGKTVNVERLLALAPDLVFTFARGAPDGDAHPALLGAGLKVVLTAEFYEPTPLGRAEWLKFVALFFNRGAEAERAFSKIEQAYQKLVKVARHVSKRPSVLLNADYRGSWVMPGGQSYVGRLLRDAGAAYLWEDDLSNTSKPIAFEVAFAKGAQADFWLYPGQVKTLQELLAIDERYRLFEAFQRCQVYNNNARLNAHGGNAFWEEGTLQPQVILADLIRIFHPERLHQHQLYWHRRLDCLTKK